MSIEPGEVSAAVVLPGTRSPLDPSRSLRTRRPSPTRGQVLDSQRGRLLDAGVQVVAEKGYEGASIQAICKQAGVAYNAFYECFGSKDALLLAAYQEGTSTILAAVAAAYAHEDAWQDRVRASISRFLHILADNTAFARFFAVEAQKIGSSLVDHLESTLLVAPTLFDDVSPAPGQSTDMRELLAMVVGSISAGVFVYLHTGREQRLLELEDNLVAFVSAVLTNVGPMARGPGEDRGQTQLRRRP